MFRRFINVDFFFLSQDKSQTLSQVPANLRTSFAFIVTLRIAGRIINCANPGHSSGIYPCFKKEFHMMEGLATAYLTSLAL